MKTGFTGTRRGMTPAQLASLENLFHQLQPTDFHHGACIGADEQAAVMLYTMDHGQRNIIAHPGKSIAGSDEYQSRAALNASSEIRPVRFFYPRNRDIVNACEELIATPWQSSRSGKAGGGGGTWYTIGYADEQGKPVHIVWPDGSVEVGRRTRGLAR